MKEPSNFPPGVTGNEPQITGEDPCDAQDAKCSQCGQPFRVHLSRINKDGKRTRFEMECPPKEGAR